MKVIPLQEKAWQDKKFWEVSLEHQGAQIKASIWPPHNYTFVVGQEQEIEGTLSQNDKGYWSIKCSPMGSKPAWVRKDPTAITKAMETKQRNITASMDRKELMILLSQANTFATEMTKTFFGDLGNDEWRDKWQENKMWFLANHATEEEYSEATAGRVIPS